MVKKDVLLPAEDLGQLNINLLFEQFNPYVKMIALHICGNTAAAEDAVQEAWVTAFTHLHQLRHAEAFLPWLKRIVINSCYQLLRKEKRTLLVTELPKSDKMVEDSVEMKFEKIAERDTLHAVLSELPLHLRETVILRYLSGYNSYDKIAAITGAPIGTVRSRLNDSKKKLSKLWKERSDANSSVFEAAKYWDEFYQTVCPGVYTDTNLKSALTRHLAPDMKMVFTSGKTAIGRGIFEQGLRDDLEHGSRITAVDNCCTSGDLTVLKVSFTNSEAFPEHCPANSYLTLLRKDAALTEMRLYHAERAVNSEFC
jgi:RNA polymerase sigma factor (sigma-70 family)